jgi:hypothetical protein
LLRVDVNDKSLPPVIVMSINQETNLKMVVCCLGEWLERHKILGEYKP